jgi:hypothetical protein
MYGEMSSILLYVATYWYVILLLPVQCLRRLDSALVGTPASQYNIRTISDFHQSTVENHFERTYLGWPRLECRECGSGEIWCVSFTYWNLLVSIR